MGGRLRCRTAHSPLSRAIDWLTHRYEATDDIIAFFNAQPRDLAIHLTAAMPTDNHLGIQPSFWHLYVQSLRRSPSIHHSGFSRLVDAMSLHLLTRYPAIRMDMIDLLNNRSEYKDLLLDWGKGLDLRRAFHANAILTACYPRISSEPLITLVKGSFSNGSDQDEWERFLLGLDFSDQVKQDLLSQLPVLVERSKIFALSILYFQGWPLGEVEINELATGLLSRSYSFDSLYDSQEDCVKLLSEPRMKPFLLSKSTDSNRQIAERASNLLLMFHKDGLTEWQRDSLYGLDGVSSDLSFYHLQIQEPGLLDSSSFRTSVEKNGNTPPSLFFLFYKALDNAAEWEVFFQRAINQGGRFIQHDYAHLFNWIVSFLRLRPEHRAVMAAAMDRLLDIPGYTEHSPIYGSLLVFAYELGTDVTSRVQDHMDDWYSDVDEETNLAITVRSGIDVSLVSKGSNGTHYILFAHHQPDGLEAIPATEITKLLADTPYLSEKIIPGIGRALLFGQFSPEERKTIAQKSSAGVVWDTVIGYCRGEEFSIERLLFTIEKDFFDRKNGLSEPVYVSMIEKIADYTAQKAASHPAYVAALRSLLTTEDYFYYRSFIIKLFDAGERPTIAEVKKLVRFLLDWDGAVDAQMAWHLSRYFSGDFSTPEATDLAQATEPVLGAITVHYRDRRLHSYLLPCWVLSLAVIRLSGSVSPTTSRAFLLGFQAIFVANDNTYMGRFGATGKMAFPGRDLLNTTWDLFDSISDSALQQLYTAGAKSNIPEVRTISRMLNALAGNRSRR